MVCFSVIVNAQEKLQVQQTIKNLFDGMRNADSLLVSNTFSDDAQMFTLYKDEGGKVHRKMGNLKSFLQMIGTQTKGALDERIHSWKIHTDGFLASVWTEYSFYFNGKKSHCGVNSFQLTKESGKWKVFYIVDTRRKHPCNN